MQQGEAGVCPCPHLRSVCGASQQAHVQVQARLVHGHVFGLLQGVRGERADAVSRRARQCTQQARCELQLCVSAKV